jgi:dUTPase
MEMEISIFKLDTKVNASTISQLLEGEKVQLYSLENHSISPCSFSEIPTGIILNLPYGVDALVMVEIGGIRQMQLFSNSSNLIVKVYNYSSKSWTIDANSPFAEMRFIRSVKPEIVRYHNSKPHAEAQNNPGCSNTSSSGTSDTPKTSMRLGSISATQTSLGFGLNSNSKPGPGLFSSGVAARPNPGSSVPGEQGIFVSRSTSTAPFSSSTSTVQPSIFGSTAQPSLFGSTNMTSPFY